MTSRSAQALLLLGLAVVWGFGANALRSDPLPLRGAIGPPSPPESGSGLPSITAGAARLAWEAGAFFVDVRDAGSYAQGHVAGALSLPADDFESTYFDVIATLGSEIPLVVYGAGPDSFSVRHVAQELLDRGHAGVDVAVCGVEALYAAGLDSGAGEEMP